MTYSLEVVQSCQEQIKKRTTKNKPEKEALEKKVKQILENPYHFKPLGNVLKGTRRVHIMGSFVLSYEIIEETKTVKLLKYCHHDEAY